MSLELLNYHLRMLSDPVRIGAWKEAIASTIRPGNIVADIGTGAGLLALLACEAGASRVFAIEESDMIEAAREISGQSPFRDRITFFRGPSSTFQAPELADVVMGDLLGVFGVTGGIAGAFTDARKRLLKPGGALLPASIEMFAAPVELPEWYRTRIDGWREALHGFDYGRCRERAVNQMHLLDVARDSILANPASLGRLPLATAADSRWRGKGETAINREGVMHGIAGWCRCEHVPGILTTNSPLEDRRTVWRHAVFPVERAVAIRPGDVVNAEIFYDNPNRCTVLQWTVRVLSAGVLRERFQHSTINGALVSPEKIRAARRGHKPPVRPRDHAARKVLDLCDGQNTLAEIQAHLLREFPDQFESPGSASDFVRRMLEVSGN